MNKALHSSDSNEWETPWPLVKAINDLVLPYTSFTLDPCATALNAKAEKFFTKEDDGLSKTWGREAVFVNPPYGREIGKWVKKSYEESMKGSSVVMLIAARTGTTYWRDYIYSSAARIIFIVGRVGFMVDGRPGGTAPFDSAIVLFHPWISTYRGSRIDLEAWEWRKAIKTELPTSGLVWRS